MPIVVSDTSPIRALSHLQRLDLLAALYGEVLIPPAVAAELENPASTLPIVRVASIPAVRVEAPTDPAQIARFRAGLDPGESEALALAIEVGASLILMDEAAGRAVARTLGIEPVGVLGVLVRAKNAGLISSVVPLMDRLRLELDFFISPQLHATVRRLANE